MTIFRIDRITKHCIGLFYPHYDKYYLQYLWSHYEDITLQENNFTEDCYEDDL